MNGITLNIEHFPVILALVNYTYQLPILLYHRVVNETSAIGRHKLYVKEKQFRRQMQWLSDNGYQTLTFRDLEHLPAQDGNNKKVILTFDDGYADNYSIMFPILKEFGFKAVIFLVTGLKWNEWGTAEGEPTLDLLNTQQVHEMDAYGIEFGGHTQHHIDMKESSEAIQRKEINGCFKDLEELLDKKPVSFSYPFGAYNEDTLKLIGESAFSFGITTIFGPEEWTQDELRIRRIEIGPKTNMMSFRRKVSGRYLQTNRLNYYINR